MKDSEIKIFPEAIRRKLIALREEGISQDFDVFLTLLFIDLKRDVQDDYERILKLLQDTGSTFNGEILEVHTDYVIMTFDIFRVFGDEPARAITLASQLLDFEFVRHVFVSQRKGIFRYINIKGREFVFIDSSVFSEYIAIKDLFDTGIFIDENVYSELYHNVKVEPINEHVLKVLSLRECFIPLMKPVFIGKNPLDFSQKGKIITIRGDSGVGKTRSALQYLLEGGFNRVVYVKLATDLRYKPFSAVYEIAKCLEFYGDNENSKSILDFVRDALTENGKTCVYFENAEFIDPDSIDFISKVVEKMPGNSMFIFEGGNKWEGEITVLLDSYAESKGISMLKLIAGGRKPDKSVVELLNLVEDIDYQFIYDFFTILSFRKFFIFGEDIFYLSPIAHSIKNDFSKNRLYKLLFESLNEFEIRELLRVIFGGNRVKFNRLKHDGLLRLIKYGVLRIDGSYITIASREVANRFLRWVKREIILEYLERDVPEDAWLLRSEIFSFLGENREAFRNMKRFAETLESKVRSLRLVLSKLLDLNPLDREKIEIQLKLHEIDKIDGRYDTAMNYLKEALKTAKSIRDKREITRVLYYLGKFNLELNQNGAALVNFKDALSFAFESKDHDLYIKVLLSMAEFYVKKNDMEKLEEILKKLSDTNIRNDSYKAKFFYYKGLHLFNTGRFAKAHSTFEDAYNVVKKIGKGEIMSYVLGALAKTELLFEQYKVAERYAEEALSIYPENVDAYLTLSRLKFREHKVDESLKLLYRITSSTDENIEALLDLAAVLAYKGHYSLAITELDKIIEKKEGTLVKKALKRKARYLLRLGHYAKAYKIITSISDEELLDEFNIFLMGDKYEPVNKTPYIKAVISFATLSKIENLDFSGKIDYDYIDMGDMLKFREAIDALLKGDYEFAYQCISSLDNEYFRASLGLNIAKYIMDRGGDGNIFLKESGNVAEKEGYLEVLMWLYFIVGKRERAKSLFEKMFQDNVELKDNYIQARKEIFDRI